MTFTARKKTVHGLFAVSLVSFALHCLGYLYFHKTAPTEPNQMSGRTYAVRYRGDSFYVTKAAYTAWWCLGLPSFLTFCIAIYLDHRWLVTQASRNRACLRSRNKKA